jgi:GAF domain-containing protein
MASEPVHDLDWARGRIGCWSRDDMAAALDDAQAAVRRMVPSTTGLTLAGCAAEGAVTFAATSDEAALMDGVQYAVGGPGADCLTLRAVVASGQGALRPVREDDPWSEFTRAAAAHGILSSLSLPVRAGEQVVGVVNVYARRADAFDGQERVLASLFRGWAARAITSAGSAPAHAAAPAPPRRLGERAVLDQATVVIMAVHELARHDARDVLTEAADAVGRPEVDIARAILGQYLRPGPRRP